MQIGDITIGFIGYGAMAQGIARGLVGGGVLQGSQIVACAADYQVVKRDAAALGVRPLHSAPEVVAAADAVIIAVRPNQIEEATAQVRDSLAAGNQFVISIAWGWNHARYRQLLGPDAHDISVIPNMPISVGQGVLVTEREHSLSEGQYATFTALFSPIALIEPVDTASLDIAGSVASCAPAFTDMYVEALADAGVKHGLTRASAYRLAAKMTAGSGALVLATGQTPAALKDAVCSPGGSTIRGVAELERHAFRGTVIDAVDAVMA